MGKDEGWALDEHGSHISSQARGTPCTAEAGAHWGLYAGCSISSVDIACRPQELPTRIEVGRFAIFSHIAMTSGSAGQKTKPRMIPGIYNTWNGNI